MIKIKCSQHGGKSNFIRFGRMIYHPNFQENHGKPFSESDLEYLCKYYEQDHTRSICYALRRTEFSIRIKVRKLKENGLYEYYKTLNKHW